MKREITAYVGLIRTDGHEPKGAGYARSCIGTGDPERLPDLLMRKTVAFPDVMDPGYGEITGIAVYDHPTDGNPLYVLPLKTPMNVHAGVLPVVHNGVLYRGVGVEAKITARSMDFCGLSGGI